MIVNIDNIIRTKENKLYYCKEYVDTNIYSGYVNCVNIESSSSVIILPSQFKEVYTKETNPEYYL